ncbi:MAG: 30S ribosomal protein S8 [Patescibacteria group bacterium]
MHDPIADMLTRIRNAYMVKKEEVYIPYSGIKFSIAKILEKNGMVGKVEKAADKSAGLKIVLKYNESKEPAITHVKRISKPGRRLYLGRNRLPIILNNYGIAVVSTPQGLMTNREAKKKGIGGEIICEVY